MSKTMSEHLHAFHKAAHENRSQAILNCSKALDKAAGMEPAGGPTTAFLKSEISRHEKMQAHHADGMAECEKAISDNLNKLAPMPEGISRLAPPAPGTIAVPRAGAPAAPANYDPGLAKIFGLDQVNEDEEEASLRR